MHCTESGGFRSKNANERQLFPVIFTTYLYILQNVHIIMKMANCMCGAAWSPTVVSQRNGHQHSS